MNRIEYGKEMADQFLGGDETPSQATQNPVLHRKTKKRIKKQFINWSLNRHTLARDIKVISTFCSMKGFVFIRENERRIQFRKFLDNGTSIHLSAWKKHYGFNIDIHIDVVRHKKVKFSLETLKILSELYIHLKKCYGKVFMLPREKCKYQGYVSKYLPRERVYRKKNRPKRKLR